MQPLSLRLEAYLNGQRMQDSNTNDLISSAFLPALRCADRIPLRRSRGMPAGPE
jgi:hypothetical protein